MTSRPEPSRILLCASPAQCAQILLAAGPWHLNLHGLQLYTEWPHNFTAPAPTLLWALLDGTASPDAIDREQQWRSLLIQSHYPGTVHMLYGNAAQQAHQLKPWIPSIHGTSAHPQQCYECLDADNERRLFRHLQSTKAAP